MGNFLSLLSHRYLKSTFMTISMPTVFLTIKNMLMITFSITTVMINMYIQRYIYVSIKCSNNEKEFYILLEFQRSNSSKIYCMSFRTTDG